LLPNRDQRLKAGMYARVEIEADRRPNALMVPSNAVLQEASLVAGSTVSNITRTYYLFVAEGERAVRRNVTLGYTTGDRVEITSGIRPDDKIIVQGHSFLQNGQRVSPASE
ncbi:MAG TPA: efflux RND transporter periplasmic adaptor subunit, partial [Candidatus Latescibacteria bacterium]|nr:efflux RND transporter periplasmic adaptor subunit [Candidatus Latescibacterota bacterium]